MSAERGEVTLTGLLVAMVIFLAVLGATLSLFAGSETVARDTALRNDAQDRARLASDTIARQLRNLASPTVDQPQAVERAKPREIVFKTVDSGGAPTAANVANVKRVRYCLDQSGRLWKQEQVGDAAVTGAVPGGTSAPDDPTCSSTGWTAGRSQVIAANIVNYANGLARPVFTYNTATLTAITSVRVTLFVDMDSAKRPAETRLSTGVFLRNQNRPPTAAFTVTQTTAGLMLNGSVSSDPDGDPLTYCWYDARVTGLVPPQGSPCSAAHYIGQNITFHYLVDNGTQHDLSLEVRDQAGLLGTSTVQSVTKVPPAA
jgi:type II secretory pathway pseudopilin PulG